VRNCNLIIDMEIREYQKEASRTNADLGSQTMNDLHMVLGMQTESAEIADQYKKHLAYGRELDLVNVKEELGDLMWYVANLCEMRGWDLRDIMATNIEKLRVRFPEKFEQSKAITRDLEAERSILEK
jgi:NTP pyrophosphatase (non-canonical NTP hydrolase)